MDKLENTGIMRAGSIRERLVVANIVAFEVDEDGLCWASECCDEYYSCRLTKDELLALVEELKELAESLD